MAALALLRAIRQVGDLTFLRVVVQGAALAAAGFAGLAVLIGWCLHHLLARHVALADPAALLGGGASLLLSLWLFLPVAAAIASLFLEPICRAVERRWYPGLPPAAGASLLPQARDGLVLAAQLSVLTLLGLLVALALPGAGIVVGWTVEGWAIGRGLFVAVAMRRMSRVDALSLYRGNRLSVLTDGGLLALAGSVPLLNLLLPVIGPASMVHLVERARSSGRSMKIVATLAAALLMPGLARGQTQPMSSALQAPTTMRGHASPYIDPARMPAALTILPAPPSPGSPRQAADEATFKATRALRGSTRWDLATRDAELAAEKLADDFSCAAGVRLTQDAVPSLFRIMDRAKADVAITYRLPKEHYDRQRPFVGNGEPICVARDPRLAANGSYPSGHATIGDSLALILAEAAPSRSTQLLARGRAFGESRVVCGVHWASDVEAGFLAASSLVAALNGNADFRADVATLRGEIAGAKAGDMDASKCAAESEAVAHSVLFQ